MPGKVKVRIVAGRNLPVMDRSSDTCDAFAEVKLGNTTYKTEVFRRSLNPQWNSEWFRFELDDEELQDEPLQIRIMDYDTYSANDAVGKVYIGLNPLLAKGAGSLMSGWFPIYDTMHGIRGEVNIMVKVDLFTDSNKYRESSCGVQFFYSQTIPHGYRAETILGFVEELVVNDDPEYQWIDKIRTPRASNEARQTLFIKLSGEVQRRIGLKALDLGGNAVTGYHQYFDLEGESGVVVRGIGTAVILVKQMEFVQQVVSPPKDACQESPLPEDGLTTLGPSSPTGVAPIKISQSPAKVALPCGQRRSSDSDLSTTPKANSVSGGSSGSGTTKCPSQRPAVAQDSLNMLEYPFITMKQFPSNFVQNIGGVVSARSVKLLLQANDKDEPETRDTWWTELRKEIRSHVRALGCNVVVGYTESTNISEDICVLSASGTAAVLCSHPEKEVNTTPPVSAQSKSSNAPTADKKGEGDKESRDKDGVQDKEKPLRVDINLANQLKHSSLTDWEQDLASQSACNLCHIPYSESSVPFPVSLVRCYICCKYKVPDVLFTTIDPPTNMPVIGKGCLIQARVCRTKKDGKGEQNAKEISDSLPFLEYELHRQLLHKLKVKGMNSLFGLNVQIAVGDKLLMAVATATGIFISALPAPTVPKITCGKGIDGARSMEIQKLIQDAILKNKDHYNISPASTEFLADNHINGKSEDLESSDDDLPNLDFASGNKDTYILEVDDAEDVDIIALLIDPKIPDGVEMCNTESLPGVENITGNLQMFSRVYRTKLTTTGHNNKQVSQIYQEIIQSLLIKLRRLQPCCILNLNFQVDLSEQDDMLVSVLGVAAALGDPGLLTTIGHSRSKKEKLNCGSLSDSEMIFSLDEDKNDSITQYSNSKVPLSDGKFDHHFPFRDHFGIEITPLSYVPGAKIERYLGNLNFFFIRESTSIREYGGVNCFIQSFITEVLAMMRAHVTALGGNGVVAFHMRHCVLLYSPHKNQGQCLINVAGDAVFMTHQSDCDFFQATVGNID